MRNKWLLSILMIILALPFFSSAVFAEETVVYEDGDHPITAKALNAETGERSGAAGFLNEDATLIIIDGEAILTITVPHNPMAEITGLQVEGNTPVVTEDENARYMAFKLDIVKSELNAKVSYEVPSIGMVHNDVPLKFALEGLEKISVKEEEPTEPEEAPTKPEEPVAPEEPTEPEQPVENDGDEIDNRNPALVPDEAFTINYVSTSPSVNRQFGNPVALLYKDGKKYIQINGTGGQYIKSLTINEKEVTWGKKNADGTFIIQFEVEGSLSDKLVFGMVIDARGTEMTHTLDLSFDVGTQTAADISNYTLLPVENDSEEDNNGETPAEGEDPVIGEDPADKEDTNESDVKEEPTDKNKTETPKKDQLTPDKAYEISFVFKHETEDKTSAADSFFVKPAILLEKDGERYIQITVTGSQYIDSLKNKFGDFVVVKENADGSVVYQFKLDGSISDAILLDMVITVPGIYEGQAHKARLFLDESSMKEVDVSNYRLVASTGGNGPTVEGESDDNTLLPGAQNNTPKSNTTTTNNDPTIEKPTLGSNETSGSTNELKVAGQEKNPQTGDTTNILLYVLLLIGSAIPLAVMAKRRFANVA